ncbi:uncharacterized protein FA14DRAFT_70132 [Meira miltonrushii]|uniref:F-BAR domain-containing protein n=1 Tax=Meira miltonrushii TaxID=1280837 RepID=A0A316VD64_9BASI|nr:uncharacterized protein FA14DRAFT_70132 [Meira miltonrushii]PWN34183.1 hypothetical protein FA14DRAFT_70132 [Meira miltonrushii]
MKRLFGNQNSSNNTPAQTSETNTVATSKRPTSPSETTSLAGSTTAAASQRAPLYSRASHSFSSQALQTPPSLLSPHTPSTNNVNPFELFPPSLALSPINSHSSSTHLQFTPLQSSTSYVGASPMAAVQHIAPQYTGQTVLSTGTMTTVQPGTVPILSDSNASATNMQSHAIERNDLHKSVKALEGILISLDEYRDLRTKLAKCEKKLSKGLNEMAKVKAIEEVPSQTLQAASDLFDARMEVSSKQAKIVQKEYDALNDQCAKYFKRIAKEERTHDEQLESLDSKIKKTQASYDKSAKKGGKLAIESHDKFIANMQSLTADMAKLKTSHSSSVGTKTFSTSLLVAATLGGLADTEYKGVCEIVRRSGQHIGKLNEWLNFTTNEAIAKAQPIDLGDDGSGIAQRIAIKEAEIREEIRRQEQIRLRQLEDEHAMLKLQQLGWTPPTNMTEESPTKAASEAKEKDGKSTVTMANLPRLDSNGNLVDAQKSKKPSEPNVAESASNNKASEAKRMSSVRSNTYESHHLQGSSMAEGTVIIRDAEPEKKDDDEAPTRMQTVKEESGSINENEANCPPSPNESSDVPSSLSSNMSASISTVATSKGTSEDSNALLPDSKSAGPLTPIDEKPDDVIVRGVDDKAGNEWRTNEKEENNLAKEQNEYIKRVTSPTNADQNREKNESTMAGIGTRFATQKNADGNKESSERREEQASSRSSVWERERDRERQMELERRLVEAENRLRMMDRPDSYSTATRQSPYDQHHYYRDAAESSRANARPRYSEPVPKSSSSASRPIRLEEEIPASRYEPDRYTPAVGGSRIEGPSVTRSLSTDSERSFVARMKALYQADKMQPQDTRRRDNIPTPTSPRRIPEIAHAYSSNTTRNGTITASSSNPPRGSAYGHYDSATAPSSKSRARYDSAPTQIRSGGSVDEFGRQDYNNQSSNTSRSRPTTSNEPPHASSCGCWNCSARHYRTSDTTIGASVSMATTKAGILPPQPPPRHPEAISQGRDNGYNANPPPNYRRQTMQVPPSGNAYASNTVRSVSGTPNHLMRPEQSLQARRSFEDDHSRHVNFTREHGIVR